MHERQAVVDGLLTNYIDTGEGPAVLLLHGWGDSKETFKALLAGLKASHRCIILDLPGFGKTQPPNAIWGLEEYADFLNKFLRKVSADDLYAVIAHSNGGALAIKAIAKDKLRCRFLMLLAASGIRDRQKGRRLFLKVIAKSGKAVTFWLPERHKKTLRKKLYGAAGSDMLVAPHLQETFKKTVRQDVQADARHIRIPTLLIYGEEDAATPPLYGRIYQNLIAQSTLEILGNAGHFVHHDRPEDVLRMLKEFMR